MDIDVKNIKSEDIKWAEPKDDDKDGPVRVATKDEIDDDVEACSIRISGLPADKIDMQELIKYFAYLAQIRGEPKKDDNGDFIVTFNNTKDLTNVVQLVPPSLKICGNAAAIAPCKAIAT